MTLLPGGRIVMSKNLSRVDEHGNMYGISYAAQTPWLRHQSIRDNILFGYPYDEARYKAVIECCALQPDLNVLEDGDATEIGARVALARAVYVRSKYVLLDDPLSAVDSHTARFLFEKLFNGPLLANRTVILVTHHVDLVLPTAHYLVRMLDGRIDLQGTVAELRTMGVLADITHDAQADAEREEVVAANEEPSATVDSQEAPKPHGKPRKLVKDEHRAIGGVKWNIYNSYLKASSYLTWAILLFAVVIGQLLSVGEKLWIKTWGSAYEHNSTVLYHSYQSFSVMDPDYPVDASQTFRHLEPTLRASGLFSVKWPSAIDHPLFYVGIYAAICLTTAFVNLGAVATQYTGALRASRILFKQLLVSVVRATFRFHDTTPVGRMLNRFGLDMEKIDQDLAGSLQTVNTSLAGFFASVITITVVFPAFIFPAVVLGYIYYRLAIGYLNTGRDLRRMESNSRSPIYSDFAFSAESRFLDNLHKRINTATKMWYTFWYSVLFGPFVPGLTFLQDDEPMAFAQLRLYRYVAWSIHDSRFTVPQVALYEFLTVSMRHGADYRKAVFITAVFSISFLDNDAGLAGLALTSALTFTNAIYWACRNWTTLEVDLKATSEESKATARRLIGLPRVAMSSCESENLVVKYSPELPSVIHGISFTLKAGERVGLIGRTGSGKSTLAMSLLRFVDPVSGRILIDGVDISSIGVNDLRSRITFIPQDATLFSGTLRDNLDPFGDHDDATCMDALYRVHLISDSPRASRGPSRGQSAAVSPLSSRPASAMGSATDVSLFSDGTDVKPVISLNTQVSAGGTNFSQGQRQLIAMARALLRRSAVVIMDEATSSVDFATDAKIQNTIRQEFTGSLLITVAHRLKTIIDYDRLVVLDNGKGWCSSRRLSLAKILQIAELDTPFRLIHKEDSVFRSMCLNSGSFAELEAAARLKAEADGAVW
ncbi:ABC bile acid [Mycena chlorophos]|uniref:ABC bile acid n=1 Tax=Mycena chlorophos TaxID=658473 RepID=A0A8H6S2T5_MYCCL|nr:ABC bile acid [Mycena chlorophos]